MKRIYLAVPYSHPDEKIRELRFLKANEVAAKLMCDGHVVFSPISHSHPIAKQCELPKDWEFWKEQDMAFIEWCDVLYILTIEGWRESKGLQEELILARRLQKSIIFIAASGKFINSTECK